MSRTTSCGFFAEKNPISFIHYQHYSEIFPASLTKLNSKCARKLLKGTWFCEKKSCFFMVSGHWAKPTRSFEEIFSARLSKLHLQVPENHFDGTHSLKKFFFTITLGHWEKKFQLFDERFSTGFQRSLSTCPGKLYEEYFWENLIFWN